MASLALFTFSVTTIANIVKIFKEGKKYDALTLNNSIMILCSLESLAVSLYFVAWKSIILYFVADFLVLCIFSSICLTFTKHACSIMQKMPIFH